MMFRVVSVYTVGRVDYIVSEFNGLDFDIFSTVMKLPFEPLKQCSVSYLNITPSPLLNYLFC